MPGIGNIKMHTKYQFTNLKIWSRYRLGGNIEMDLKEIMCDGLDWIIWFRIGYILGLL